MAVRINMETNFGAVAMRVSEMGRQAIFATAVALTRTGQDVRAALKEEMPKAFDRPTAYTLNSLYLKGATKANLEARVWLKDNPSGKGTPADRYLKPQIAGGTRAQKGMEKLLQLNGMMPAGYVAVPGAGAQIDAFGNVRRAQIVQIMSQLKVQRSAGFESRASGSTRSNRTIARQGVTYFAVPALRRGLQPGIYVKRRFAQGSAIKPVFIFVRAVQYRARFKFFEVGEAVAQAQFPRHFQTEMAKAIASARLR